MAISIDDTRQTCTLINTFDVAPTNAKALVDSLRRFTETFMRYRAGFVGDAVHVSRDGSRVVNYVQWRSDADLRAALNSAEAREHLAEVERLAERITPVFYEVVYVA